MIVVCCQVEGSASGWSLAPRSPTDCVVSECDREASIMRKPWPTRGCCAMEKEMKQWWIDNVQRKTIYAEKNVSQCHFFNHESRWMGLGSKSGLMGVEVGHLYIYIYICISKGKVIPLQARCGPEGG